MLVVATTEHLGDSSVPRLHCVPRHWVKGEALVGKVCGFLTNRVSQHVNLAVLLRQAVREWLSSLPPVRLFYALSG